MLWLPQVNQGQAVLAASSFCDDPEPALAPYLENSGGQPSPYHQMQQVVQRNDPALVQRREQILDAVNVFAPSDNKWQELQQDLAGKQVTSLHSELGQPAVFAERMSCQFGSAADFDVCRPLLLSAPSFQQIADKRTEVCKLQGEQEELESQLKNIQQQRQEVERRVSLGDQTGRSALA